MRRVSGANAGSTSKFRLAAVTDGVMAHSVPGIVRAFALAVSRGIGILLMPLY